MEKKVQSIGSLKVGRYVLIDNVTCKIIDMKHSAPGKHGHGKIRMSAVGVKDGKKRIIVKPADARMDVPVIEKGSAQVLTVKEKSAQVMDLDSYETFDIAIPEEFAGKVKEGLQIVYWMFMGEKLLQQIKGS
jgi:translation initiation factor 5A